MTVLVLPREFDVFATLRSFILANVPAGVDVIKGQVNRVPEPRVDDFIVMTPINRRRLNTNVDTYTDAVFTGTINGTALNVTSSFYGDLSLGSVIYGIGITDGTAITAFGTGSGAEGTYTVNNAQTFAEGVIAAGTQKMLQPVEWTVQLDVHGPNSSDNSHRISTVFRDEYAATAFAALGTGQDVMPLYADDPKQIPFVNDQSQLEWRWVLEACFQANQAVVNIPQQFFDRVVVGLIDVDTFYPA